MKPSIIFAGTPAFAAVQLKGLLDADMNVIAVYTQPDRPAGRGQKLAMSPVKELALSHNLPVMQPKTLQDGAAQSTMAAFNPDIMVVAAYGLILPKAVLSIPEYGCVNVHASLLPRWRGAAPIQRAILAGDQETGITIMQMDEGLDTGAMLHKVSCAIDKDETAATLHDKLQTLGSSALNTVMLNLAHYMAHGVAQNNDQATYADKINKLEAQLDWHLPADQCVRAIRAYNPVPGAYTWLGDQRIKLYQADTTNRDPKATPGTIITMQDDAVIVAAGEGCVAAQVLQLPGKKPLPAHLSHLTPGQYFGAPTDET